MKNIWAITVDRNTSKRDSTKKKTINKITPISTEVSISNFTKKCIEQKVTSLLSTMPLMTKLYFRRP